MKHTIKIAVISLTIAGLLSAQSVWAESAGVADTSKQESSSEIPKKCDREAGKLDTLKSDLKLNANQEAAWTEWGSKIKADRKSWESNKNIESWASLSAPERMEKILAFSKERVAKQEARLAATKTFYATLTPEQRQIFDKDFKFQHRGRFVKH